MKKVKKLGGLKSIISTVISQYKFTFSKKLYHGVSEICTEL